MTEHRPPAAYHDARQRLESVPGVLHVDVLPDDPRLDRTVVELTIGVEYDRVPPRVCRALAEAGLGIHDISPRGDYHVVVAV